MVTIGTIEVTIVPAPAPAASAPTPPPLGNDAPFRTQPPDRPTAEERLNRGGGPVFGLGQG